MQSTVNLFLSTLARLFQQYYINWINYGAQFRTYTKFVKSFHPNDRRLKMIITQYADAKVLTFKLVEDASSKPLDNARSFKDIPNLNTVSENNDNALSLIRYIK